MRPLRLTMTAFGPYAGTETVDFDALTDLGLFVVAGNNGSGKTTIFDALHYCLFGLLPGRRATYLRLRSDHAPADVGCSVQLDFAAKGKMWRIERSPKQKRPKRRGQGQIEVDRTATLYRFDDDHPVAVANKIGQVNELCRELVGLSGPQFERVALLPQGEFSRVLSQSGTERRELLRALFSSEVFGDASTLLNDQAAAAAAADTAAFDRLELQRAAAATQVSDLIGAPADGTETDLLAALTNLRNGELHDLERRAALLGTQADDAARAHQAGIDLLARFKRRHDVTVELAAHHDQLDQYERDLERLAQARAAVPVASQARTANQQKARLDDADQRIAALHQRVNRALQVVGLGELAETSELLVEQAARATHAIHDQLIERGNAALTVRDLDVETKRLQGELRRRSNDITVLAERIETTTAQRRQAGLDLERLDQAADVASCERELANLSALLEQRTELDRCQRADHKLAETLSELRAHCDDLQQRHDVAQDARATSSAQQLTAQAAIDRLTECERRIAAAQRFASATQSLQQLRIDHRNAQAIADDHWDAFIAGTAARVAETLTDDEPCPVCGSADHPEPARPPVGDEIVDESAVARTREQADQIHDRVRQIEATIEAMRATDPAIASLDLNELREDQATAKAKALAARTKADQAHQAAAQLDQLATELASARQAHADLIEQQRTNDQRRHNLQGALGALADQSVVELQTRAQSAADALRLARDAVARHTELTATVAGLDQSIETIGLEQIAAENRRTSTADQLADRQHTLQNAQHVLDQIDAAITAMLPQATPASRHGSAAEDMVDHEQRAQAARRARELLTGLTTELARQSDAAEAVRRAQLILDEKLQQSDFATADQALRAFADPAVVEQLEAQTVAYAATRDQLHGHLQELADVGDTEPDIHALHRHAEQAADDFESLNRHVITTTSRIQSLEADLQVIVEQRESQAANDLEVRRLERVAALVKGDNDRNTSLENWVLAAHLRDVVELANLRLARSTHQRFQLCVLDDGENRRGKWGLDLGVEDTVTGTRRPTAGLSGGELFQASLALALGLADAVMNQAAGVHIDALFIDEGFGSLDETSVERAIDLLDELRDRGALVGVITHVTALLEALPVGINVVDHATGQGSTIRQAA